jgi:hypothetical protein
MAPLGVSTATTQRTKVYSLALRLRDTFDLMCILLNTRAFERVICIMDDGSLSAQGTVAQQSPLAERVRSPIIVIALLIICHTHALAHIHPHSDSENQKTTKQRKG